MTQTLGIGIVGFGAQGRRHAGAFEKCDDCSVVAVVPGAGERDSSEQDWPSTSTVYPTYEALLEDERVDVVSICSPNHCHGEQALGAIASGRHTLVEKPVAVTPAELRRLDTAARASRCVVATGLTLRWYPLFEYMRSVVKSGALGPLFLVQANFWQDIVGHPLVKWAREKDRLGGVSLGAVHAADILSWVTGLEAEELVAYSSSGAAEGFDYDRTVVALVRFRGGGIGRLTLSLEVSPYAVELECFGSDGVLRNNRLFQKSWKGVKDYAVVPALAPQTGDPFGALELLIADFVSSIRKGTEARTALSSSLSGHEMCLAIEESLRRGESVKLPLEAHG